jgi:tRNA(Ile)-lysidine synthetase-like protein
MLIPIPGEAHYFRFRAKLKVSPVAEEQPSLPKLELLDKTEKLEPLPAISLTPPAQPSQPPASESAAQPTESEPGNAEAVQQPTAENGQETQPEQTEPAHQLIEAPQATEAPQAIEEHAPTPVIDPVDPGPPGPAPVRVETILADLSEFEGCKLELRSRQPGDRIQLPGMAYPVRLKKLMIERGIPRFERDQIPVIAVGRDVLWAVGLDVSTHVRPKAKPTHRIELEFYP